jgi:uncharacterized protein (DUF302 family)
MHTHLRTLVATFALAVLPAAPVLAQDDGVIRVKSAYSVQQTIERIKADISAKGIMHFAQIDQAELAAAAGIQLRPSTLLIFGNPPLGTLFITAKAEAGLDWPVRLLVSQDDQGQVWAIYSDFQWIAARHGIRNRDEQFATASGVVRSITSSITQ